MTTVQPAHDGPGPAVVVLSQQPTALDARASPATGWGSVALFLGIALFTPNFVFFVFSASSGAPGLLLAAILLVAMLFLGLGRAPTAQAIANALAISALGLVLIVAHGAVAGLIQEPELARASLSAVAIVFMLFAAIASGPTLFHASDLATGRATHLIRGLFVIIGLASLLGIQPPAFEFERPIFPFTEPSHYALAFAPLLIDGCVRTRPVGRWLLLATGYVLAYMLQSLSLVVAVTVAGFICLPVIRLGIIASIAAVAIAGFQLLDVTYFTERVSSDSGAQNISRLVYVQGWELISGSLSDTWGWGQGFQQLGFAPINSPTADQLFRLLGTDANLKDGGFTAAKVISEFGVFGIFGIIMLLYAMIRAVMKLHEEALRPGRLPGGLILANAILVAYATEMFVRGVGYFSGTTMLLFSACSFIGSNKSQRVKLEGY